MQCDFCSSQPVAAIYKANNFVVTVFSKLGLEQISEGGWAACVDCESIIDKGDWDTLVKFVTTRFIERHPAMAAMRTELERDFKLMYSELRSNGFTKTLASGR